MFAYVGGYTSEDRRGRAEGITVHRIGNAGEPWSCVLTVKTTDNPSLLRMSRDGRTLYAVHGAREIVSAYRRDPAGFELVALGSEGCGGVNPVDLGLWPGRGLLTVTSYTSGTVAVLPVAADGALRPVEQSFRLQRPGHAGAAAMPHGVTYDPSGSYVLIPDKGLDCVFVFRLGSDGMLQQSGFGACAAGSGPRHAAFHPRLPIAYVVNELSCTVQSFHWDAALGTLTPLQSISTLPPGAAGFAAEIAVAADGRSVYVSTRGHDSIAHFGVDASTGLLSPPGWTPCQGREPRYFALAPDGLALYVANQESDEIVAFALDQAGRPGAGSIAASVGSPTAICFA